MTTMHDTFAILAGFLERFTDEVEGRQLEEPSPKIKKKLRALARGKLSGPEREELVALLQENRHLIPLLAQEVKTMRLKETPGK